MRGLYNECYLKQWLQPRRTDFTSLNDRFYRAKSSEVGIGVQAAPNVFILEPPGLDYGFQQAMAAMGPAVMITMCSEITAAIFKSLQENSAEMAIKATRHNLPVVNSLDDLSGTSSSAYGGSFACLVKEEKIVVVCTQALTDLMPYATEVENKLLGMVRGSSIERRADTNFTVVAWSTFRTLSPNNTACITGSQTRFFSSEQTVNQFRRPPWKGRRGH